MVPATPNLALFLSSMARLQRKEAASLVHSGEVERRMRSLRRKMVWVWARESFKLGFRERLKRMERARVWSESGVLERARSEAMAASVWATRLRFWGLTLVMVTKVWRACF